MGESTTSSRLRFDSEGVLSDGERRIAHVESAEGGAFARVSTGGRVHEIVRRRRSGWRFLLVDPGSGGRVAYDFRPGLLRRGGTIAGEGEAIGLHPHRRQGLWRIASPDHASIDVDVAPGQIENEEEGRPLVVLTDGLAPALELCCEDPLALSGRPPELLAFACWLIARWESTPAPLVAGAGG